MLLRGRWELRSYGPLDATHLRWFSPSSLRRAFEDAGYVVDSVGPLGELGPGSAIVDRVLRGRMRHLWHRQIDLRAHVPPVPDSPHREDVIAETDEIALDLLRTPEAGARRAGRPHPWGRLRDQHGARLGDGGSAPPPSRGQRLRTLRDRDGSARHRRRHHRCGADRSRQPRDFGGADGARASAHPQQPALAPGGRGRPRCPCGRRLHGRSRLRRNDDRGHGRRWRGGRADQRPVDAHGSDLGWPPDRLADGARVLRNLLTLAGVAVLVLVGRACSRSSACRSPSRSC